MRSALYFVLLPLFAGFVLEAQFSEEPVQVQIRKSKNPNTYELSLQLKDGYGFQKEAPHRILLSGKNGLQVKEAKLNFQGPTNPKKPEYFAYLEPMPLVLAGSGELEISGRIFYCNYLKNLCIPGKLQTSVRVD